MSSKTPSGNPESSREIGGINVVIANIKSVLNEALTPKMEELLKKMTEPTLKMFEKLINPKANGTQDKVMQGFMEVLNRK